MAEDRLPDEKMSLIYLKQTQRISNIQNGTSYLPLHDLKHVMLTLCYCMDGNNLCVEAVNNEF